MSIDHYENFPVASLLLPARLRHPVSIVYKFARSADDIADEGDASADERLDALRGYDLQLERLDAGLAPHALPEHELFVALAAVLERYGLEVRPFRDLLSAFSQDAVTGRYESFADVLDYCSRSANPVGRIMLGLYRADSAQYRAWSDQICSALQLINFWQDVAVDRAKNRIYLPLEDLRRFGIDLDLPSESAQTAAWQELMAFECERAGAMMRSGVPLAHALPGRIGFELRMVVQGGLRILEKIKAANYDVFNHRPVLGRGDWLGMLGRAFKMRP